MCVLRKPQTEEKAQYPKCRSLI
uniref:Uncharacterized protein n=1 Tax=Anguilla anguilla TaxID=7936 RepID=A0A0E9P828_ANGAN